LAGSGFGPRLRSLLPSRSDLGTISSVQGGREIVTAGLIDYFGSGLYVPVSTLYLLRIMGLSAGLIGIVLGIGGGLAIVGPVLAGHLGQRLGPGKALITLYLALFTMFGVLALAPDRVTACVAVVAGTMLLAGAPPLQQQLVGQAATGETRTAFLAVSRTAGSIALGAGGLMSVIGLAYPYPWVLRATIGLDAASFACVAVFLGLAAGSIHRPAGSAGTQAGSGERRSAWQDARYVGLTLLHSFMSLDYSVMRVAVPLWLVGQHAPLWLTALAFTLSTGVVIVTQVGAGRHAATVPAAGGAIALTGLLFAIACVLLGVFPYISLPVRIICFVAATVSVGIGESFAFAAGWTLSYSLAPSSQQGEYLGVFGVAAPLQRSAGPILMTLLVLPLGVYGWLALAGAFLVAGQGEKLIARRARTENAESPEAPKVTVTTSEEG